jgi:hypothetical protein
MSLGMAVPMEVYCGVRHDVAPVMIPIAKYVTPNIPTPDNRDGA